MLCYRHPKESKKNREKAGKLISECLVDSMQIVGCVVTNILTSVKLQLHVQHFTFLFIIMIPLYQVTIALLVFPCTLAKILLDKIILITISVPGLCFTQDYYKIQHQREQDISSDFLISFFLGLKFFMASNGKIWFNLFPTQWGVVVWLANMPEYNHWQMNIIRQSLTITGAAAQGRPGRPWPPHFFAMNCCHTSEPRPINWFSLGALATRLQQASQLDRRQLAPRCSDTATTQYTVPAAHCVLCLRMRQKHSKMALNFKNFLGGHAPRPPQEAVAYTATADVTRNNYEY